MAFTGTGRFEVIGKLGEGGMGIVYEAFDHQRGMTVALKTLRNVDAESLRLFKREFRALHNLSHPNIIHLYELIAENGQWFLTMELIDGDDFITHVCGGRTSTHRKPRQTELEVTRTVSELVPEIAGDLERIVVLPTKPERPVDIDDVVDLSRLQIALGQLAGALHALHTANMVHRDLKPGNVRITREGRLVLMDFGIVGGLAQGQDVDSSTRAAGTPSFMAPEQLSERQPTAAADWYSFGVLTYVALTGLLPFEGPREVVMNAKREFDPWPPSAFTSGIPKDLESLCMALLARDPTHRPKGVHILNRFGIAVIDAGTSGEFPVLDSETSVFVGRRRELDALRSIYIDVRNGGTSCVFIEGTAGIGRSSLVRRFLHELRTLGVKRPLVLSGHSRARESLAYKAFDGVIDDLTNHLRKMTPNQRRAILPDDATAIAELFPSLRRVPELKDVVENHDEFDPRKQRDRALDALRALLSALAIQRTLVLCTDDIQWADRQSLELLLSLLQTPTPRKLLVLATLRTDEHTSETEEGRYLDQVIATLQQRVDCRHISLGPLSEHEQRELMKRISRLPKFEGISRHLEAPIWRESAGNPMLLAELARSTSETPTDLDSRASLRFEDVLWSRFQRLTPEARALMECIVLADEPLPVRVLAAASELSAIECERASSILRVNHMVRISRSDREPWLAPYHYKVCEAIKRQLSEQRVRQLHLRIAHELEHWGQATPAHLADQWLAAGRPLVAARHRFAAAQETAKAQAFERAATQYRDTLSLLPDTSDDPELDIIACRARIGLVEVMSKTVGHEDAFALLERAQTQAKAHDLFTELALIHHLRGNMYFPLGDLDRSRLEHERAREYARQTSSARLEAMSLGGVADALYGRGQMTMADAHFRDSIAICKLHGFQDIEIANRVIHGLTRYFQNDLAGALHDSVNASVIATRIRNKRTEVIARSLAIPWILCDMGRLHQAQQELEVALKLCDDLQVRRFEPFALAQKARILYLRARRRQAEREARKAATLCSRYEPAFAGPVALGVLARVTGNEQIRRDSLVQAEKLLNPGVWSHCHLIFYRDAIDVCLHTRAFDRIEYYANALEQYASADPLPWSRFFAARGRALRDHALGHGDHETLTALYDEAREFGMHTAARALASAATDLRAS